MKHPLELFEQPIPILRRPKSNDARDISALAKDNHSPAMHRAHGSMIANRFAPETSVVAELDGKLVGWALAYVLPFDPETLFIWKVEVSDSAAENGLASLMMGHLIRQDGCANVTRIQTAIAADDDDSWSLFRRFADWQHAKMNIQPFFTQSLFPKERHRSENLVTIDLAAELADVA